MNERTGGSVIVRVQDVGDVLGALLVLDRLEEVALNANKHLSVPCVPGSLIPQPI